MNARRRRWLLAVGVAVAASAAPAPAADEIDAEQPAALLTYPYITADTAAGGDTMLQLSNSDGAPVDVHCIYVDAIPTDRLVDFHIRLTPHQPIAWRASQGLAVVPLATPGDTIGVIPPVRSDPFTGSLRCVAVEPNDAPTDRNVLTGDATIEHYRTTPAPVLDAAAYRAIGIQALAGRNNGDNVLLLGGPDAEYIACPHTMVLQHFADAATLPATNFADASEVFTTLVVLPCSQDLDHLFPSRNVVQLFEYNEFEQSLGTAQPMEWQLADTLSHLGGTQPERSIFHVSVQGTLTGQTLISSTQDNSGVLAIALETHRNLASGRTTTTAFTVQHYGARATDTLILPSTGQPTPTAPNTPPVTPTSTAPPTRTPSPTEPLPPSPTATSTASPSRTPTARPAHGGGGGCSTAGAGASAPSFALLLFGVLAALFRRCRVTCDAV